MPAASAAWMIIEPLGAETGLPSISNSTRSGAVSFFGCALRQQLRGPGTGNRQPDSRSAAWPKPLSGYRLPASGYLLLVRDSCRFPQLLIDHRPPVPHEILELVPVMAQEALHWPSRGLTESADGVAFDLSGDGLQAMQIVFGAFAFDDAFQLAVHPPRALDRKSTRLN